jgi:hypothetical protein
MSHNLQTMANRVIETSPKSFIDKLMEYDQYIEEEKVAAAQEKLC